MTEYAHKKILQIVVDALPGSYMIDISHNAFPFWI